MSDRFRFLDEELPPEAETPSVPGSQPPASGAETGWGPILLESESDAPAMIRSRWAPERIEPPSRQGIGSAALAALGVVILLSTWLIFSTAAFLLSLDERSRVLSIGAA